MDEFTLKTYAELVEENKRLEEGITALHHYLLEHPEYLRFSPVLKQASAWLTNLYNGKRHDE